MSNIDRDHGANVGIELQSITVVDSSEKRGECWLHNVSNQFPINCSDTKNGEVSVDVDVPHKGYVIQTKLVNGKPNGVSRILNKENIKIASLVFVDGVASGPCTLNDDEGRTFFKGYFENGYRKGKGKEYDENGNVIFEGFFEQGKRMNIVEMKEMKGYWKEMNEKNEIVSICQKDEEGRNEGICYFYANGKIDRISEWKNGEEISDSGYCKIFDEPSHVFFEGYFENGKREGKGKEVDLNGKVVFEGFYEHGNKLNIVVVKEMKGYWKEMNDANEVISICKKDEEGNNDGICYFYSNSNIDRISEWKNGEEVNVLKRFEGKKMIEFVNGVKRYEGEYRDSIKHNYPREGKGKEYGSDGKSLIYQGQFWNGKRQGKGISYRNGDVIYDGMWIKGHRRSCFLMTCLVFGIAIFILCYFVHIIVGCIVVVLLLIVYMLIWRHYSTIRCGLDYDLQRRMPLKNDVRIGNRCCNVRGKFQLHFYFFETIVIGDDCFRRVNRFELDGLNYLKSLKIGRNSFTLFKSGDGIVFSNESQSFSILNCIELKSIEIGGWSFSDYGGGFELKNLPKLESIIIGEVGIDSSNFYFSSFVIKGIIDMILLMNRSSEFKFH